MKGLDRVDPAYVNAQLVNVGPDRQVTTAQIVEDTGRMYALGDFERVEYSLTGPPDARVLDIQAVEKSWGPDFVRFDLGLAGNIDGRLDSALRVDHNRTWVNSRGAEWHNAVQLGEQSIVETDFYQPLDVRQRFFVQPTVQHERALEDIFNDSERVASYRVKETYGQLDIGANVGTRTQLRLGVRSGWIDAVRETGPVILPEPGTQRDSSLQLRVVYDTRDVIGLPTRGTFFNTRYVHSASWLGGEQDYDLVEGVLMQSWPWRGDALSMIVGGGKELAGTLPATQQFQLGGIRTYPGLLRGELRGTSYWYAGTKYNWRLADIQPLFGQALYAGLRLQAGRVGDRIDNVGDGALYGISTSLNGRTPIGPFSLSLGWVDNGNFELQFAVGRPITEGSILDEIR